MTQYEKNPSLIIRNADVSDAPAILALCRRVYPDMISYSEAQIRAPMLNFPEGQYVALYQGKVVGYCATFRISGEIALAPHTWKEITGGGFASRHDPEGDYLYGMEICVDPELRGLRIGQRLYNERKKLCRYHRMKGIVFAGRIPGLQKRLEEVGSAENYVKMVQKKKILDPVLSFQIRNGFEVIGILKDYLMIDHASLGYAVHLVWKNPQVEAKTAGVKSGHHGHGRMPDTVRIATIQYGQRRVKSYEEFEKYIAYFVDTVSDYGCDFVCFPELFTLQLLSIEPEQLKPAEAIEYLTRYVPRFKKFMSRLAVRFNINIVGGSHPAKNEEGEVQNACYVFLRDGAIHSQLKIHPTPNERYWWNIRGGDAVNPIMTDCGPIGVMICYDCEFPELGRVLVDQGARILFVPFCTDERQSYLRVRYCAQARAVENQVFVVMSGNVGNLPGVANMDIQYAQSCILTPCDFPFARDGIAADTTPNVETVAVADLRLENLNVARNSGTVQQLKDRRFDLYNVTWNK